MWCVGVWFVGLAAVLWGAARADAPRGAAVVPQAVRSFLSTEFERVQAELPELREENDDSYSPAFTLLYFSPAVDSRDGASEAWVVGYCLGTAGNGAVPINRAFLIDRFGGVNDANGLRQQLPDVCAGDEGMAFEVCPGTWMLASSFYGGRHAPNSIRVYTLAPNSTEVLDYRNTRQGQSWNSTMYFMDLTGDGHCDVGVNRTVRDSKTGRRWKEFALYAFNNETGKFDPFVEFDGRKLDEHVRAARAAGILRQLRQYGPPEPADQ